MKLNEIANPGMGTPGVADNDDYMAKPQGSITMHPAKSNMKPDEVKGLSLRYEGLRGAIDDDVAWDAIESNESITIEDVTVQDGNTLMITFSDMAVANLERIKQFIAHINQTVAAKVGVDANLNVYPEFH